MRGIDSHINRAGQADSNDSQTFRTDTQLFYLLERISGPVWPIERYQRLDRLLKSRVSEPVMSTTRINEHTIIFHEQLETKLDVLVASAVKALEGSTVMAKALDAVITIMRKMDVLSSSEVESASLKQVRKDGLGRWVERRLRRGTAPTVPLPSSLRQITTCSEMVALGRQLKNCLGDVRSLLALVMGEFVFLRLDEHAGPIVVSLARGPAGCWMIHEAQGSVDRWDDVLIDEVQDSLREAGLDVVGTTMKGAFQRFAWP